jgi:hypothetical protein
MGDSSNESSKRLAEQFAKAAALKQQQTQQMQGSEMVKNSKPFPQPTPPGSTRSAVDQAFYNQRLDQEKARLDEINAKAKARSEAQKQQEEEKGRDDDDDRGK